MSWRPMKGPTLAWLASVSSAVLRLATGLLVDCTAIAAFRKRFSSVLWYCG